MRFLHLIKPEQNNSRRPTFLSHLRFQISSVKQRLSDINQKQTAHLNCHFTQDSTRLSQEVRQDGSHGQGAAGGVSTPVGFCAETSPRFTMKPSNVAKWFSNHGMANGDFSPALDYICSPTIKNRS